MHRPASRRSGPHYDFSVLQSDIPHSLLRETVSCPDLSMLSKQQQTNNLTSVADPQDKGPIDYLERTRLLKNYKWKRGVLIQNWPSIHSVFIPIKEVGLGLDIFPQLTPKKSSLKKPSRRLSIQTRIVQKNSSPKLNDAYNPRSLSEGDLGESLKGYSELRRKLVEEKKLCDEELTLLLSSMDAYVENCLKEANSTESMTSSLFKAIVELASLCTLIIHTEVSAMIQGGFALNYMTDLQKLHSLWTANGNWDCGSYVVRALLSFSRVTRCVELISEDVRSWKSTDLKKFKGRKKEFIEEDDVSSGTESISKGKMPRKSRMAHKVQSNRRSSASASPLISPIRLTPMSDSETSFTKQWSVIDMEKTRERLNILFELNSEGQMIFISSGCKDIFGYSSEEVLKASKIASPFLFVLPGEVGTLKLSQGTFESLYQFPSEELFDQARMTLSMYSKSTVELLFTAVCKDRSKIRVKVQGILHDDLGDLEKQSIWVLKPISSYEYHTDAYAGTSELLEKGSMFTEDDSIFHSEIENNPTDMTPADLILCQICERSIPVGLFENHSSVCASVHRIEMSLSMCREELLEKGRQCATRELDVQEMVQVLSPEDPVYPLLNHIHEQTKTTSQIIKLAIDIKVDGIISKDYIVKESATCIESSEPKALEVQLEPIELWYSVNVSPLLEIMEASEIAESTKDLSDEDQVKQFFSSVSQLLLDCRRLLIECVELLRSLLSASEGYKRALYEEEETKLGIGITTGTLTLDESKVEDIHNTSLELRDIGDLIVRDSEEMVQSPKSSDEHFMLSPIFPRLSKTDLSRRSARSHPRVILGNRAFEVESINSPLLPASPTRSESGLSLFNHRNSTGRPNSKSNLGPRDSSSVSMTRNVPSIKDYEIIKPVSKGAFGSVYLAKKRNTGEYFAIKMLKKADMVAKNQVTNVRSERMILSLLDSPFVVKLYYSFQSKENLYLVMEYLNGGDCASLIKTVGALDEGWARQYVAEVVLGLEFLHSRSIIHRDLKPDNLLIDARGHLKLTDFGLSRNGFLGRTAKHLWDKNASETISGRIPSNNSLASSHALHPSASGELFRYMSLGLSPALQDSGDVIHYQGSPSKDFLRPTGTTTRRDSITSIKSASSLDLSNIIKSKKQNTDNEKNKFVGTPDYLAPESILGLEQTEGVDWWALGVIMYEFLYGFPPFHASTPNQVFEKILSRSIEWFEEDMDLTEESKDLMNRLICISVEKRLGNNQVKQHAFFSQIHWETLLEQDGSFIPKTDNIEDTNYFDNRGAKKPTNEVESDLKSTPSVKRTEGADFGEFAYKNLPLLEKANSDLMRKLKSERSWSDLSTGARSRKPSTTKWVHSRGVSTNERPIPPIEDSPQLSQTSGDDSFEARLKHKILESPGQMSRNRFKKNIASGGSSSAPMSPITPSSFLNETRWTPLISGPRSRLDSISSTEPRSESPFLSDNRTFCILVADDNIVSCTMLESMILNRGNCECVCVHDGAEAIRIALGTTKFDLILMDLRMPIIDGETAAKMIRTTDNINKKTLIIAMTTETQEPALDIFDQFVKKPLSKQDLERLIL